MDKEIELFAQKAMLLERIKNQRQNLGNLFVPLEEKCNNIDNVADGIIWLRNNKQIVGIATAICDYLESKTNTDKITTHASITARPFFEKRGYVTVKEQQVIRHNVALTNYIMEKQI